VKIALDADEWSLLEPDALLRAEPDCLFDLRPERILWGFDQEVHTTLIVDAEHLRRNVLALAVTITTL